MHINRAALGESVEEQENTIARIVYFFEKFWDKILRFSRRTETQADRWASRYGCSMDNPKESLKGAKHLDLDDILRLILQIHLLLNCEYSEVR